MVPDQSKASRRPGVLLLPGRRPVGDGRRRRSSSSAKRELEQLGLADPAKVERGFVTRVPQGLPDVRRRLRRARRRRSATGSRRIGNLQQVGRNGLHRYNNSDHSMLTAIRAVENIIDGHRRTTSGRSTPSPSTTRRTSRSEQPYKRAPETQAMREPLHATEEAAA